MIVTKSARIHFYFFAFVSSFADLIKKKFSLKQKNRKNKYLQFFSKYGVRKSKYLQKFITVRYAIAD